MFSQKAQEELRYYVYCLVDPRDKKIFYVGKGVGNRVFAHACDALENEDVCTDKLDKIREIINSGHKVKHYIIRHKLTEEDAFTVESVLIDFLTYREFNTECQLTNLVAGHHQWDEGIKTVEEIEVTYNCEKIVPNPNDRMLLVSLNKTFDLARKRKDDIDLYQITRQAWVVAKHKAEQVNYVLGVYRGIVRSVVKVTGHLWGQDGNDMRRCSFVGELEEDSPYLNKDASDYPFGSGGAITYINI